MKTVTVGAHGFITGISASFNRESMEVRCMVVGTGLDYSIVIRDGQVTFVKGRERSGMVSRAITPENAAQEFVGTITPYV